MIVNLVKLVVLGAVVAAAWWGYRQWQLGQQVTPVEESEAAPLSADESSPAKLSPQARKNLGLVSKPITPTTYWRTIDVPGIVVDKPGVSDRGVVAPVAGTVIEIHAFPGATVAPNAALFTIRLVSESLHASQLELFKATREIEIAERQRKRLADLAQSGAVAQSRIIEIDNQIDRLQVSVEAYRQDLVSRRLPKERIDAVAKGEFVTEMVVRAPSEQPPRPASVLPAAMKPAAVIPASAIVDDGKVSNAKLGDGVASYKKNSASIGVDVASYSEDQQQPEQPPFSFELQSLNVELGQQVAAGHVLCHLADHRALLIEGHGFKDDMPLVQEAARQGWPIEVDLDTAGNSTSDKVSTDRWPAFERQLKIDHLSNSVDPQTRTFTFFLPLENQWQAYTQDGETRLLWRFRPGSRVRLRVAVAKLENVLVVPQQAVVREGPETFVFRQNGDLYDRRSVHLLYEDRVSAVLANDGAISPGSYVAQNGAASINRVMKAQAASGMPSNVHVHADGSVHGAH